MTTNGCRWVWLSVGAIGLRFAWHLDNVTVMRVEIDAQLIDLIRKRVFADFFRFQWTPRSISRRRFDWLSLDDFRSSIAIIQIV